MSTARRKKKRQSRAAWFTLQQYIGRVSRQTIPAEKEDGLLCRHCGKPASWVHTSDNSPWCGWIKCHESIDGTTVRTKDPATPEQLREYELFWNGPDEDGAEDKPVVAIRYAPWHPACDKQVGSDEETPEAIADKFAQDGYPRCCPNCHDWLDAVVAKERYIR